MEKIRNFNTEDEYNNVKDTLLYPTVSAVKQNMKMWYAEKPRILTYTTTEPSQEVKLVNNQEYLDYCRIVETGEELPVTGTGALNYTFTDPGEHEVELKFKDDATTLAAAFYRCSGLTGSIPENLFSNNTKVTYFNYTFYNCSGLTGNVPVDSDGTPIYNRSGSGKPGYAILASYNDCFRNCTGLTDYNSIPADWGGGYKAPVVTYTTTKDSQSINLVNKKEYLDYAKIVDTGEELPVNGTGTLSYTFSNPGEHQIELKFKDNAPTLTYGFSGCTALTSIPENLFSNCTAVTSFDSIFANCSGLTGSIPENLFKYNTAVNSFQNAFEHCTKLTGSIPENLFKYNTAVTTFIGTFNDCIGLTGNIPSNIFQYNTLASTFTSIFEGCYNLSGSIPEYLFSNNIQATDFSYIFSGCYNLKGDIPENLFKNNTNVHTFTMSFSSCSGLTSVPENLFINNTKVTTFANTFQGCSGLTSIPNGLFSNCSNVLDFRMTFRYCNNLNNIPTDLFKYNKKVIDFSYTFSGCTKLTGTVPIDSDGTPIYNRSTPGKTGYSVVTSYNNCFYQCTSLTDYASIPTDWK